jgi:hypothetical protein
MKKGISFPLPVPAGFLIYHWFLWLDEFGKTKQRPPGKVFCTGVRHVL